ncbi:hypothetical protein [Paracidovorax konjaci]|nr:hypothetical protein [Paracidovorax konjaci]
MADAAIRSASATSKIRVALPLSPAASRVAAGVIFAHPALRTAVGIATWLGLANVVWNELLQRWEEPGTPGDPLGGKQWKDPTQNPEGGWYSSHSGACSARAGFVASHRPGEGVYYVSSDASGKCNFMLNGNIVSEIMATRGKDCEEDWYVPICEGKDPVPLTEEQFKDKLAPKKMPESVPREIGPGALPVDKPVVNPGTDGKPKPMFIPTGKPIRNPNYDPSKPISSTNKPFLQPGIRVTPSGTDAEPWRVDVEPVERPVDSENPSEEPLPDEDTSEKPAEKELDLCTLNPDILACAKPDLDVPDEKIPKKNQDVSYQPENLFGGGSCPADKVGTSHSLKVWDWQQSCNYITSYVRPLILLMCSIAAMVILTAGTRT